MQEPKVRPTGATANLGRSGFPHIVTPTGGTLDIVTGASQPGFNPLDLLYASLAACMAMSARIAAHKMGVQDQIHEIRAEASGEKADDGPSRIVRFEVVFTFDADIDAETKAAIIHAAEEICTVSNTLAGSPALDLRLAE
ncbi:MULTISPECIES: OsmC family protein [Alphaproteobacteria]|uniref:ABC transporter ATP-binding protein n=2 Tax=Alphaproteobacteria TaxID=28211 RepID=A0A512HNB5_9HYPH|nr:MULTISPECIES: OsmC family protein [Alphaproteobacteria]GEO86932.1 ABC transporter ATP-binding protein [Ciceribacter naphthalenivorans]GLR22246.1 ABC transporter ATP-binding protein [Ciceribacter naphthalenivorans]GLT05102.1 ABC transporter ATP-binding protein [Sphingomonas psychrolutea]